MMGGSEMRARLGQNPGFDDDDALGASIYQWSQTARAKASAGKIRIGAGKERELSMQRGKKQDVKLKDDEAPKKEDQLAPETKGHNEHDSFIRKIKHNSISSINMASLAPWIEGAFIHATSFKGPPAGDSGSDSSAAKPLPRRGMCARVARSDAPCLVLDDGRCSAPAFLSSEEEAAGRPRPPVGSVVEISEYTVATVLRCVSHDAGSHRRTLGEIYGDVPDDPFGDQLFLCLYLLGPIAVISEESQGPRGNSVDVHRSAPLRRILMDHRGEKLAVCWRGTAFAGGIGGREDPSHDLLIRRLEACHCWYQLNFGGDSGNGEAGCLSAWPWASRLEHLMPPIKLEENKVHVPARHCGNRPLENRGDANGADHGSASDLQCESFGKEREENGENTASAGASICTADVRKQKGRRGSKRKIADAATSPARRSQRSHKDVIDRGPEEAWQDEGQWESGEGPRVLKHVISPTPTRRKDRPVRGREEPTRDGGVASRVPLAAPGGDRAGRAVGGGGSVAISPFAADNVDFGWEPGDFCCGGEGAGGKDDRRDPTGDRDFPGAAGRPEAAAEEPRQGRRERPRRQGRSISGGGNASPAGRYSRPSAGTKDSDAIDDVHGATVSQTPTRKRKRSVHEERAEFDQRRSADHGFASDLQCDSFGKEREENGENTASAGASIVTSERKRKGQRGSKRNIANAATAPARRSQRSRKDVVDRGPEGARQEEGQWESGKGPRGLKHVISPTPTRHKDRPVRRREEPTRDGDVTRGVPRATPGEDRAPGGGGSVAVSPLADDDADFGWESGNFGRGGEGAGGEDDGRGLTVDQDFPGADGRPEAAAEEPRRGLRERPRRQGRSISGGGNASLAGRYSRPSAGTKDSDAIDDVHGATDGQTPTRKRKRSVHEERAELDQRRSACTRNGTAKDETCRPCTENVLREGAHRRHAEANRCTHEGCNVITRNRRGGVCYKHAEYERTRCSHRGCNNIARRGGVCIRHGAKRDKRIPCSRKGCTNRAIRGGVCTRHGAEAKRCSHEGCANKAVKGGVCMTHGAKAIRCSREGCTNNALKGGVCRRYGATR